MLDAGLPGRLNELGQYSTAVIIVILAKAMNLNFF